MKTINQIKTCKAIVTHSFLFFSIFSLCSIFIQVNLFFLKFKPADYNLLQKYYCRINRITDAITPMIVNNTPRLNAFVPGLNIQKAETDIKKRQMPKRVVK